MGLTWPGEVSRQRFHQPDSRSLMKARLPSDSHNGCWTASSLPPDTWPCQAHRCASASTLPSSISDTRPCHQSLCAPRQMCISQYSVFKHQQDPAPPSTCTSSCRVCLWLAETASTTMFVPSVNTVKCSAFCPGCMWDQVQHAQSAWKHGSKAATHLVRLALPHDFLLACGS